MLEFHKNIHQCSYPLSKNVVFLYFNVRTIHQVQFVIHIKKCRTYILIIFYIT